MSLDSPVGVDQPLISEVRPEYTGEQPSGPKRLSSTTVTDPKGMTTAARCQSALGPGPIAPQETESSKSHLPWPLTMAGDRAASREDPTLEAQFRRAGGADNRSHGRPGDQETRSHP